MHIGSLPSLLASPVSRPSIASAVKSSLNLVPAPISCFARPMASSSPLKAPRVVLAGNEIVPPPNRALRARH